MDDYIHPTDDEIRELRLLILSSGCWKRETVMRHLSEQKCMQLCRFLAAKPYANFRITHCDYQLLLWWREQKHKPTITKEDCL